MLTGKMRRGIRIGEKRRVNKKGLSAVITTILIILIVLAAIAILWQVVKRFSELPVEDFSLECINFEISAVNQAENKVTVERNGGELELKEIGFVFSNLETSKTVFKESSLKALETQTFSFSENDIVPNYNLIRIYAKFIDVNGEILDCSKKGVFYEMVESRFS